MLRLDKDRFVSIASDGHYRGSAGIEQELVYVVQTDKGQETLNPTEFANRFNWKNEPSKVSFHVGNAP